MSAGEHGRWAVVTPKRRTPKCRAPKRRASRHRCGAELLWKRSSNAPEALLTGGAPFEAVGQPVCRRAAPGLDFPAPCQARRGIRAGRAIVLILQWARIVTESQSAAATGIIPRGGTPISRKYNARTAKKRWACTIPATGVFTRFSHVSCSRVGFSRIRDLSSPQHFAFPARFGSFSGAQRWLFRALLCRSPLAGPLPAERRTPNAERRTPNAERRTPRAYATANPRAAARANPPLRQGRHSRQASAQAVLDQVLR